MLRSALIVTFVVVTVPVALARCAGCSEQCSGLQQGSEGCPCQHDQDCTTLGEVLLCSDGACAPGDPPDAPGQTTCDDDGDCGTTEACAADGSCQPAPACQRLEPGAPLAARARDTGSGCTTDDDCDVGTCDGTSCSAVTGNANVTGADVTAAPQADCGVTIAVAEPALSATGYFTRDGELVSGDCTGAWFAAHRAGYLQCGGVTVALSVAGVATCVGSECGGGGCRALGGGTGVCP